MGKDDKDVLVGLLAGRSVDKRLLDLCETSRAFRRARTDSPE